MKTWSTMEDYFRALERCLDCPGEDRERFLAQARRMADDFLQGKPDAAPDEVAGCLGEPEELAQCFLEELDPELLERRASQVSGGQIQRIVLARIMLLQPEFIVLDEPTSMLDVSVQAQIMDLLHQVQLRTGVSYLLISHDLDLLRHASSRIGIMYRGKLLEQGETEAVLNAPTHPYTRELIENFSYMRD